MAVVAPETVTGLVAPEPVSGVAAPGLADVHVAVLFVTGEPCTEPSVNVTLSGPVLVVVEPERALTAVGAAGADGFGS